MSCRIEAWSYSEGPSASVGVAAGSTSALGSTQAIAIKEQASPGTTTYARTAAPSRFRDALAHWQTTLNLPAPAGTPSGTHTFSYDSSTRRVTLASTVNMRPLMPDNAATWLGLTQDLSAGWATSWQGASAPAGIVELVGVTVEPAEDWSAIDLSEYRHGRAVASVWGNHQVHQAQLLFTADEVDQINAGYVTAGRVRIYQDTDTTAYSATNIDGYVEGFVLACDTPTEDGDAPELWTLRMLIGVPR